MFLSHLSLVNYRNYDKLDIALPTGTVILYGKNAQGKTNLLEAVYMLATTRSHRTSVDRELVRWQAVEEVIPFARLKATAVKSAGKVDVEILLQLVPGQAGKSTEDGDGTAGQRLQVQKRAKVNGVPKRPTEVVGQVNAVLFGPHDIELIGGAPSSRRRYLDLTLSQVSREYFRTSQKYARVITQRNRLLKLIQERRAKEDELAFWDAQLVECGSAIVAERRAAVRAIAGLAREIHRELTAEQEDLSILYKPNAGEAKDVEGIAKHLRAAIEKARPAEVGSGMSLVGPHRDDVEFQANGIPLGTFGSRGQQRTAALSLKLAEARFMREQTGEQPILLLDDVLSELDSSRRRHLWEAVRHCDQALLTATDLDHFDSGFVAKASLFRIMRGSVEAPAMQS